MLAGTAQRDTFAYDWATGALWRAQDHRGHTFTFLNDMAGRLIRTQLPGFLVDTVSYDVEGRPRTRQVRGAHLAGLLVDETMGYDGRGKLMLAQVGPTLDRGGSSSYRQWYSGSGMLVATDWENYYDFARSQEAFGMDALGNMAWRRTGDGGVRYDDVVDRYRYQAGMARVELIDKVDLAPGSGSSFYGERSTREYDFGGNADWALKERSGDIDGTGLVGRVQHVLSRSYYSAEDRLRYFQENDLSIENQIPMFRGVWEEYRYDALGRRVMTDTRRKGLCSDNSWVCASATTRFVWSGDQLLWELKTPSASPQEVAGHNDAYGTVGYFHAGGIDRPLVITKGSTSIIPHQNWRGQFSRGTYANGQPSDCTPNRTPCTPIAWPGYRTTAWHMESKEPNIRNWFGGLVDGMRDASGQMYMRNRYYDPATGQFTQPDPIGLAGGLNAYGFAAGDPVTYSDPYGLCPYEGSERTTNVGDCPDDERKAIFERVSMTKTGRHTINQVARLRIDVRMGTDCGENRGGCADYAQGKMVIRPGGDVSAMAGVVVHETNHLVINAERAKPLSHAAPSYGWWDEAAAFGAEFQFYLELPRELQTDRTLNHYATEFQRRPAETLRRICAASYSDLGCP